MKLKLTKTVSFSKALFLAARGLYTSSSYSSAPLVDKVSSKGFVKHQNEQLEYVKEFISDNNHNKIDWLEFKHDILNKQGLMNKQNIDAVLLKTIVGQKKLKEADSFVEYLKSIDGELSLGTLNNILFFYHIKVRESKSELSDDIKKFILDTYAFLYDKYKVLDFVTCEKLLHALCAIGEWKKSYKVLEDIKFIDTPSHSAYTTLIATLFKLNKKEEAFKLIQESCNNRRPLQHNAYEEWINYIFRKYKDKLVLAKYLDEVGNFISKNSALLSLSTAEKLKEAYNSIGWGANYTSINKNSGQCVNCKETLACLDLTLEEFDQLQSSVKEKLIIKSDLFLNTSPEELKRFIRFIEKTAPYDFVLDGLNIALAVGQTTHFPEKVAFLKAVTNIFLSQKKKVLIIGRNHMHHWPRREMDYLRNNTSCFFTDDLSKDDPFFITAAILSGPHTDIVSKDLLRGHRFNLKDEQLRQIFQRWQWRHQWMVFMKKSRRPNIQAPLHFTPCAQMKNGAWHLPYENKDVATSELINCGVPDLSSWLCITPPQR